ncbi:DUF4157 domain-containing protein [Shimia ponticola]|uniref:eCIS core domain-containing protein n=1 Tax=Shimia ponticola TaxID=2582893 RepID=UPI0011BF91B0|nr:DUF4157 domain-containing protein [Shimia ponticola]
MAKRSRIRRRTKRRAPAVRHPGSQAAQLQSKDQTGGLMIGGAHDPAEKAADAMAARVMAGGTAAQTQAAQPTTARPAHVHRKCAACEAAEKADTVKRSTAGTVVAPGAKAQAASSTAATAITSLGSGRPMSGAERGFFEPRFGQDFSSVRIHEGPAADAAARGIDADAFAHGSDIAFASGQNTPDTMAHELAHVAQGDAAVRRKITIANHKSPAPGYPKGSKVTNGTEFVDLIKEFPGAPKITLSASGEVILPKDICDPKDPKKPNPKKSETTTNECLCFMVASPANWDINFFGHGRGGPATYFDTKSKGGYVNMPTKKSKLEYGFIDKAGKEHVASNWSVLAHELCGHAKRHNDGTHKDDAHSKMRHNHGEVVDLTNKIRLEKDPKAQLRPTSVAAPNCGESLSRKRGSSDPWKTSSNLSVCQAYRDKYIKAYNAKHGTAANPKKYKLSDPLPPLGPVKK